MNKMYNTKQKFFSDWQQVGDLLRVFRFPPPIKLDYIIEILLKVALNINNPNPINAMYVNKLVTDHL